MKKNPVLLKNRYSLYPIQLYAMLDENETCAQGMSSLVHALKIKLTHFEKIFKNPSQRTLKNIFVQFALLSAKLTHFENNFQSTLSWCKKTHFEIFCSKCVKLVRISETTNNHLKKNNI